VPYTIRRSDRARHARILVGPDGVEVVVPRRFAERRIAPFVEQKRPWIERTLERLREAEAEFPPADLRDGGSVPYLGERLGLDVTVEPARRRAHVALVEAPAVEASSSQASLFAPFRSRLTVAVRDPSPEVLRAALERWYRRRARMEVAPRLDAATARAGVRYTGLQIRGQRTRWASCSERGGMSFNWRLLLAPAEILDYVVDHEVAHLEVPDHSERFWALLAARVPDYREHERWLRRHGHALRI
jgi:predicted metal-dependent hydrolase